MGLCYESHILAHLRGRLRRRAEGGAGSGVLRPRLVTEGPGRFGTPPARHYDLAARSSLHGSGGNAGDGSAAPGPKSPRWSAERRASRRRGTRRASQARIVAPDSATTEDLRLSALRSPLIGVDGTEDNKTRAQQRAAGTKKTALFDMVNRNYAATRSIPAERAKSRVSCS